MANQAGMTNLSGLVKAGAHAAKAGMKGKGGEAGQGADPFEALLARASGPVANHGPDNLDGTPEIDRPGERRAGRADKSGKPSKAETGHGDPDRHLTGDEADLADAIGRAHGKADPAVTAADPAATSDEAQSSVAANPTDRKPGKANPAAEARPANAVDDVLALLAAADEAVEADAAEDVTCAISTAGRDHAGRHEAHGRSEPATDKAHANGKDATRSAANRHSDSEDAGSVPAAAGRGGEAEAAEVAQTVKADNQPANAADNRLPLQLAAAVALSQPKAVQSAAEDNPIIIRASRTDGKGGTETRRIEISGAGDAGPAERTAPGRTMPGQTEQKAADSLPAERDIRPVSQRNQRADNADAGQARIMADIQVLEARRYVGLADTSNAGRLGQAIGSDLSAIAQSSQAPGLADLAGNVTSVVHTLKLQMHPDNLGPMTASLRLKGDDLTVDVRVETVEAWRQLTADQDSLVQSLKDQGFSVEQVNIQLAPSASSSGTGTDAGSQQNQNFGASARDQAFAGQGQQGQASGQGRDNRPGQEQGRQDAAKPITDVLDGARGRTDAAGQLYL